MTLVLIAASLIFFLWVLFLFVGSATDVARDASQAAALRFDEGELLELVAEKRAALTALKESELDYETGKVGETEYEEVHNAASAEAISVMRRLDAFRDGFRFQRQIERDLESISADAVEGAERAAGTMPAGDVGALLVADDEWEEASSMSAAARVRARRLAERATPDAEPDQTAAAKPLTPVASPDDGELGVATTESAKRGGFCIACGNSLLAGARFCAECGHKVGAPLGEAS